MKLVKVIPFLAFIIFPLASFAAVTEVSSKHIHLVAEILSFVNLALVITCIISVKQFFFPGESNRTPFQIFNIIFIVVFYAVSLTFLINNKEYYPGFEQLSGFDCVKKIFFEKDTATVKQWFIIFSLIINIAYIIRNGKDEYYAK